ncbi:hypothetical protein [Rhodoplanes roseus]|uniref:hypothetical protein n=1 Tax=Rhodoplanes roseus TaxID=29409 RepID=UPI001AECE4C2|nr:hypothetical protein [Rhodoplanes roseus]
MITAIVRYRLPPHIGESECRAHFERIAPGFGDVPGLLQKQFIWRQDGVAGGVYRWADRASAERFYSGPWREGIRARYDFEPEIEFFHTVAITDNPGGVVSVPGRTAAPPISPGADRFVAAAVAGSSSRRSS